MPFPIGAAILGGTSLLGGLLGKDAADDASDAQVSSLREALGYQRERDAQTRTDMLPWLEEGGGAIRRLGDMLLPGYDHTTSPGYEFRRREGMRGIENSAAARGILQSGGTLKGIDRYNQDYAADDFDRSFNRTASVAAGGQQTGLSLGQLGQQSAANAGGIFGQIGQARASGYAGQNQAVQGTLGNLFSLYSQGAFGKGF